MCLAVPAEVVSLDLEQQIAIVAFGTVRKQISVALLDSVAIGDFVLVHVGFALNRISPEEAEKTLALMAEAGLLGEEEAA